MEDRPHVSERANVVHLETDTQRVQRVQIAKLPDAAVLVLDRSKSLLRVKVKSFFDLADDSLFDLADKASSNQEQNVFFDSMRELRVQHRSIEMRFMEAVESAFAALATTQQAERVEGERPDVLSLVHSDDLEEMLAVDSAAARANTQFGEAIQFISLRLDSLVPVKVYQKNNPISPDILCSAFMEQIKRLKVDIKAKLVLFRLFDKAIIQGLGEIYRAINDLLIEQNIMPSLPSVDGRGRRGRKGSHNQRVRKGEATQSTVLSRDNDHGVEESNDPQLSSDVVDTLNQLLSDERPTLDKHIVSANDLLSLLSEVQNQTASQDSVSLGKDSVANNSAGKGSNIRALLEEVKSSAGITRDFGRVDDEVMNLVNMLFDFILEDRNLAAPMKALIGRLQIPIIKLAIADKTFFTKGGHVGRRLLNEMATAAIGWECTDEDVAKDPLYNKIEGIVKNLQNDSHIKIEELTQVFGDFTSFVTREKRRAAVLEKRTVDAEDGKARTEVARRLVSEAIKARTQSPEMPKALSQFIQDAWSKVLFVTALKHGDESDEWTGVIRTLDELIWSVRAPESDKQRQTLLRLVPVLLKKLRTGLDTISYNPYEMSNIFKSLEELHLAAIRSRVYAELKSVVVPASKKTSPAPADDIPMAYRSADEGDDKEGSERDTSSSRVIRVSAPVSQPAAQSPLPQGEKIDAPAQHVDDQQEIPTASVDAKTNTERSVDVLADNDTWMLQVSNFAQGSWFDFTDEGGVVTRCRLAAVIKSVGRYIFVNRNGMKVAEKTQQELAQALKTGRLGILDNSMLFDRALETIVTGLRKPTPP